MSSMPDGLERPSGVGMFLVAPGKTYTCWLYWALLMLVLYADSEPLGHVGSMILVRVLQQLSVLSICADCCEQIDLGSVITSLSELRPWRLWPMPYTEPHSCRSVFTYGLILIFLSAATTRPRPRCYLHAAVSCVHYCAIKYRRKY